MYLSGTSEILGISSTKVVPTPGAIVFPVSHGLRVHAAPTQNGGDAKLWFTQVSGLTMKKMSALVAENARSSATPLFLPQLEGERAPHWDPDLRGAFLGRCRHRRGATGSARGAVSLGHPRGDVDHIVRRADRMVPEPPQAPTLEMSGKQPGAL